MRILVHDWAGHPFQAELSRELARRGHTVYHAFSANLPGPKGALAWRDGDSETLSFLPLSIGRNYNMADLFRRPFMDIAYADQLNSFIRGFRPDIVLSANTPLDAQSRLLACTHEAGGRFIFWLQDIISEAMMRLLPHKLPVLGRLVAVRYRLLEKHTLHKSDAIVCITEDFVTLLHGWGIPTTKCVVIENWASKNEILPVTKDNSWSRGRGLAGKRVFLYSGTLGMKHNPESLLRLAEAYRDDPGVAVVVISQGQGADWLAAHKQGLENLILLPYQPYEFLSEVLATGDVLVCIIEAEAGIFSVPSKVLSYLAAARALLLAVPATNLAARIVRHTETGYVVPPNDSDAFIEAARKLIDSPEQMKYFAANARAYAESAFDITVIANKFESVMQDVRTKFT